MIGVFIIPTGIGCEIGGHSGDASPTANLIASCCNKLIAHPNVYNASDINEMAKNVLYVEGSILDRLLENDIWLTETRNNKILVVTNSPLKTEVINSVSAARATIGLDAEIVVLKKPLELIAKIESDGSAGGDVYNWKELVEQVESYKFDALAITTQISVDKDIALSYLRSGGVNPWGAVEAKASKLIATELNKPVAHSPIESEWCKTFNEIVDPRMSAETVSISYLHCILKGLHKSPRINGITTDITVDDIDFLITPVNCVGKPHRACLKAGIPVIAVKENTTCLNNKMPDEFIVVENYLECVGMLKAIEIGIDPKSVRRPLEYTKINE